MKKREIIQKIQIKTTEKVHKEKSELPRKAKHKSKIEDDPLKKKL